jgi:hypothetical protein
MASGSFSFQFFTEIPPNTARPRKISRFLGDAPGNSGNGGRVSSLYPPKML